MVDFEFFDPPAGDDEDEPKSITGQDAYMIAKALAYAIEMITALPPDQQERLACEDFKVILTARTSEAMRHYVIWNARLRLRPK